MLFLESWDSKFLDTRAINVIKSIDVKMSFTDQHLFEIPFFEDYQPSLLWDQVLCWVISDESNSLWPLMISLFVRFSGSKVIDSPTRSILNYRLLQMSQCLLPLATLLDVNKFTSIITKSENNVAPKTFQHVVELIPTLLRNMNAWVEKLHSHSLQRTLLTEQ